MARGRDVRMFAPSREQIRALGRAGATRARRAGRRSRRVMFENSSASFGWWRANERSAGGRTVRRNTSLASSRTLDFMNSSLVSALDSSR